MPGVGTRSHTPTHYAGREGRAFSPSPRLEHPAHALAAFTTSPRPCHFAHTPSRVRLAAHRPTQPHPRTPQTRPASRHPRDVVRARAPEPSPSPRSGRVALDARTLRSARVAFPMHRISVRAGPALARTPRNTDQPNHGVAMTRRASSSRLSSFRPRCALPSLRLCPEPKDAP
jgi:hypothetical protein